MGKAKDAWIEAQDRGWDIIDDKFVCPDCVEDAALQDVIAANAQSNVCSYCGSQQEQPCAAPVQVLQEVVFDVVRTYYNQPDDAGVPYEGGYLVQPIDTDDVLQRLGFDCHPELMDDILQSDMVDSWVEAADGHWATLHEHEVLQFSWSSFEYSVKHEVRYFFGGALDSDNPQEIAPGELLGHIESRLRQHVTTIPEGTRLYRVRLRGRSESWEPDASQMGAPPPEFARSGRMNPAGIPYLYTSLQPHTALREVGSVGSTSDAVFVATFEAAQDLKVMDLTNLPPLPSVFDLPGRSDREHGLFLRAFIGAISRPIEKNGQEHVEYVPTQVLCEFVAQEFRTDGGEKVAGVLFPSSVVAGGQSLVIFPTRRGWDLAFDSVVFKSAAPHQHDGLLQKCIGTISRFLQRLKAKI